MTQPDFSTLTTDSPRHVHLSLARIILAFDSSTIVIPVPREPASALILTHPPISPEQTKTEEYRARFQERDMAIACGAVSNNLCAAIFHDAQAADRFVKDNPPVEGSTMSEAHGRKVFWIRITGIYPSTNQDLQTFQWVADGSAVRVSGLGYSLHPDRNPCEMPFFDIKWPPDIRSAFRPSIIRMQYGGPTEDGDSTTPRLAFWARYFAEEYNVIYDPREKQFLQRDESSKAWIQQSPGTITSLATRLFSHVAQTCPKFEYVRLLTTPSALKGLLQTLKIVAVTELGDERAAFNDFLSRCLTAAPAKVLFCADMHQAYREFCTSTGRPLMPDGAFYRLAASEIRKRFGIARRNDLQRDGHSRRGFEGLQLIK